MRIVDRKTFLSLPAGTVYAKWGSAGQLAACDQDLTYGEVAVKGDTVGGDWVEEPLLPWPEGCEDSEDWVDAMVAAIGGTPTAPLQIGDFGGRDGLFDDGQLFAVYDRVEVERLVALFENSLAAAYSDEITVP